MLPVGRMEFFCPESCIIKSCIVLASVSSCLCMCLYMYGCRKMTSRKESLLHCQGVKANEF